MSGVAETVDERYVEGQMQEPEVEGEHSQSLLWLIISGRWFSMDQSATDMLQKVDRTIGSASEVVYGVCKQMLVWCGTFRQSKSFE